MPAGTHGRAFASLNPTAGPAGPAGTGGNGEEEKVVETMVRKKDEGGMKGQKGILGFREGGSRRSAAAERS